MKTDDITAPYLWEHDHNPHRPYARLSAGKISNLYFNGEKFAKDDPVGYGLICAKLAQEVRMLNLGVTHVIGAAQGGIPIAIEIARTLRCGWDYVEHEGDSLAWKRYPGHVGKRYLMVDDTATTGRSFSLLETAVTACDTKAEFVPVVIVLCNRTKQPRDRINGRKLISHLTIPDHSWADGHNPHTRDGKEPTQPLHPRKHWTELTRPY